MTRELKLLGINQGIIPIHSRTTVIPLPDQACAAVSDCPITIVNEIIDTIGLHITDILNEHQFYFTISFHLWIPFDSPVCKVHNTERQ